MAYHHGNLRSALVDAAVEIATADGPDAVVLREVSRRVGVSHNAAYRHFADRDELLRAVAARGLVVFHDELARHIAAGGDDPGPEGAWARMDGAGRGYVAFATGYPGLFRTTCAFPLGSIAPEADVTHPYALLSECIEGLIDSGAVPPERRGHAELAAWSAVHGYSMLVLDGPLRDAPAELREQGLDRVLQMAREGL